MIRTTTLMLGAAALLLVPVVSLHAEERGAPLGGRAVAPAVDGARSAVTEDVQRRANDAARSAVNNAAGRDVAPTRPVDVMKGLQGSAQGGGGKSMNPLGAEEKFKKDLNEQIMRGTSEEARTMGQQAGKSLGQGQGLGQGQTPPLGQKVDDATKDKLKAAKEAKERMAEWTKQCTASCKGEKSAYESAADAVYGGLPKNNMPDPSKWFKTEEEKKAAEEAAKKKQEHEAYLNSLSPAEKLKVCVQECVEKQAEYYKYSKAAE